MEERGVPPTPGSPARAALDASMVVLRAAEDRYRRLFEAFPEGILMLDHAGAIVDANPYLTESMGYHRADLLGKRLWEIGVFADVEASKRSFAELSAHDAIRYDGFQLKAKDGRLLDVEFGTNAYEVGGARVYQCNVRDVSERKRSEDALREARHLVEGLVDAIPARVCWKNLDLQYLGCNRAFAQDAGFIGPTDVIGKDDFQMAWRDQAESFQRQDREVIETGRSSPFVEESLTAPDGRVLTILTSRVPLSSSDGATIGVLETYVDITERKAIEQALSRVNRALKTISAVNGALVHALTEGELLQRICALSVEVGGYALAWVGYAQADADKTVTPVTWAGEGAEHVKDAQITWADDDRGNGPTGRAIRLQTPQLTRDIDNDPSMAPWKVTTSGHGYRSAASFPLIEASAAFGTLTIVAREPDAFDPAEIALLTQMAADLSYGITTLRTRLAHEQSLLRHGRSLAATVRALARTVELRDAYTAGHQRRVSELCAAIARELALDPQRIVGLTLAADVHDIGKVSIPAEILAKPTKLSAAEFDLVHGHAEAGHQILQGIDFPWPVAEMVYQHHERIDGSGYPRGLVGDDILLEARILAVSDVFEAMSSHRPYRPALGPDAALAALAAGRGSIYDADVVDACVKVVREQRFEFARE